ncbi:hypothetical protein Taro_014783 [Colocasia esculenta]|uniref:Uncharacterized protein n=1 Tax=Colocasia esculenta TaxID=4460 RepID=A0A843UJS1_COLES|nr:hypothetical protein [Colocasia esculenta]
MFSALDIIYYGGVISEFDSHSKKHTILKEDGEYEVLDLSVEDWELLKSRSVWFCGLSDWCS